MAEVGTLPEYIYQKNYNVSEDETQIVSDLHNNVLTAVSLNDNEDDGIGGNGYN